MRIVQTLWGGRSACDRTASNLCKPLPSDALALQCQFVIQICHSLVIRHSSFLHTRIRRSLFEIVSDSERTHRFQEGNLPGGL